MEYRKGLSSNADHFHQLAAFLAYSVTTAENIPSGTAIIKDDYYDDQGVDQSRKKRDIFSCIFEFKQLWRQIGNSTH